MVTGQRKGELATAQPCAALPLQPHSGATHRLQVARACQAAAGQLHRACWLGWDGEVVVEGFGAVCSRKVFSRGLAGSQRRGGVAAGCRSRLRPGSGRGAPANCPHGRSPEGGADSLAVGVDGEDGPGAGGASKRALEVTGVRGAGYYHWLAGATVEVNRGVWLPHAEAREHHCGGSGVALEVVICLGAWGSWGGEWRGWSDDAG